MTQRKPTPSYTAEFRARGVRLFKENRAEYASDNAAYLAIAPKLGCSPDVLKTILKRWPWLRHIFADGGYAGPKLRGRLEKVGKFTLEIVKRSDQANGFEALPRRWVVERTFAWLGRCRRLAKDFEKTIASSEAWIYIANIRFLTRRIARA